MPYHLRKAISWIIAIGLLTPIFLLGQTTFIENYLTEIDSLRNTASPELGWQKLAALSTQESRMSREQRGMFYKFTGIKYYDLNKIEEALLAFRKARSHFQAANTDRSNIQYVFTYYYVGSLLLKKGKYNSAKDTLDYALAISEKTDKLRNATHPHLLSLLASTSERQQRYEQAIEYINKSIQILHLKGDTSSSSEGYSYNTLGVIYNRTGKPMKALEAYKKSHQILANIYGKNSSQAKKRLRNISSIYNYFGEYDKELIILTDFLNTMLETPDKNRKEIALCYYSLAGTQQKLGDLPTALKSAELALSYWKEYTTEPIATELSLLNIIANLQLSLDSTKMAITTCNKSIDINKKLEIQDTQEFTKTLSILTNAYFAKKDTTSAIFYAERAFKIARKQEYGLIPSLIDKCLVHLELQTFIGNNQLVRDSLDVLFSDFNKVKDELHTLQKASTTAHLYELAVKSFRRQNSITPSYQESIDALQSASQDLLNEMIKLRGRRNQRAAIKNSTAWSVYSELADVSLKQASLQPEHAQQYILKALSYIDVSLTFLRGRSPLDRMIEQDAKVKEEILDINSQLAANEKRLLIATEERKDEFLINDLRKSTIELETRLEEILPPLEKDSSLYTRFNSYTFGDEPFFVFHENDGRLFSIYGADGKLKSRQIPEGHKRLEELYLFKSFVQDASIGFHESGPYLEKGKALFKELFGWALPPLENDKPLPVKVVLTERIAGIPFSALPLSVTPKSAKGYRSVVFAINNYDFSYYSSITDLINSNQQQRTKSGVKILAAAPSLNTSEGKSISFAELPYAKEEVLSISQQFQSTALVGPDASLSNMLGTLPKQTIFHLATHAVTNPDNQDFSYLIVTDSTRSNGKKLYAQSIKKLDIPTELVVLSACESGEGVVKTGEGSLSLATTFLDAGARSVINSQWQIDDKQSKSIMLSLYAHLHSGKRIDAALAQAKRDYLYNAPSQATHPYYWSAFVANGATIPLVPESKLYSMYWIYTALIAGTFFALFLFLRLRQHRKFARDATQYSS